MTDQMSLGLVSFKASTSRRFNENQIIVVDDDVAVVESLTTDHEMIFAIVIKVLKLMS